LKKKLAKNENTVYSSSQKSQGSGIEWPLESYLELANELLGQKLHRVLLPVTEEEGAHFKTKLPKK